MHPILFELFGKQVHTYSVAMALGFVVSIILLRRRAPLEQIDANVAMNIALLCIVGTLLGGRLMFVINTWSERFATENKSAWDVFLDIWKVWEGGLVFYGGFLGSVVLVLAYAKIKKIPFLPVVDLLAPYVGLGLAIHRPFGCFMNGCCYGEPTDLPWGVHFPLDAQPTRAWGIDQALHPTQIYMGISGLMLFLVLRWYRQYKMRHGEVFGLLFVIYAVNRFLIEFVRGDKVRGHVPLFDLIYPAVFIGAILMFLYLRGLEHRHKGVEWVAILTFTAAMTFGLFGTSSGSQFDVGGSTPFSTSQYLGFFVFIGGASIFYYVRRFGLVVQPEYGTLTPDKNASSSIGDEAISSA